MASLSHRQGWSCAVLFTTFPRVFFASTKNDAPVVTFHSSTSEVRVSFFATDENNRLVENLSTSDFAVVDGDIVVRNFRSLERSDETALDIVLLPYLSVTRGKWRGMRVAKCIIGLAALVAGQFVFAQNQTPELKIGDNTRITGGGPHLQRSAAEVLQNTARPHERKQSERIVEKIESLRH